jgi:hypothetical protein
VPESKGGAYNKRDADRAFARLVALYEAAL